tara:strand:- start:572 stop:1285 length:714 start_codon:yes stop_codon:yes gene_type:complete
MIKKINEINKKDILAVKYVIRPVSNIFSIIFITFGIAPNTITYIRLVLSFIALIYSLFIELALVPILFGFFFLLLTLDYSDGTVARYKNKESVYGKFIDGIFDLYLNGYYLIFIIFQIRFNLIQINNIKLLIVLSLLHASHFLNAYFNEQVMRFSNSNYSNNIIMENSSSKTQMSAMSIYRKLKFYFNELQKLSILIYTILSFYGNYDDVIFAMVIFRSIWAFFFVARVFKFYKTNY